MTLSRKQSGSLSRFVMVILTLILILALGGSASAQEKISRTWGIGWDNGLTARTWLGGVWEVAVAAGPDDYLSKEETRSWFINTPESQQGLLEVPQDIREEHGWVRLQVGRLIKKKGSFAATGYAGVVYEWMVHQDRKLILDELNADYDTFELDRHTRRWIMTLGIRPSWQPVSFLTVETAFGLNFIVENWDQTLNQTWAGQDGTDYQDLDGHGQKFQDFGLESMASIQFFIWL